ncbi:MAG TPA: hypothetical protein VN947_25450 [Polyangia bacterium]|nr:hypothetical protein [Polyangia bacterium]
MGRFALGVFAAALVALAIWAALPTAPPMMSSGPAAPTPIVPNGTTRETARPPLAPRPLPPTAAPARPPEPTPVAPEDLDAKIAGCVGAQSMVAQARARRGGPAPAGQPSDAAMVARGCAPLYREAGCREAMMRFDDPPPARRSAAVLEACAHAYCDKLSPPKPAVCSHVDNIPQDEQQYTEWNDLRLAILTHDIGASAAQLVTAPPPRQR